MRCNSKTKKGKACKANAVKGRDSCLFHLNMIPQRGYNIGTRRSIRKYNRRK